ncbi:MAG: DNA topoisomerase IB [Planctomycetes bacterium]|nr:DNA topoisomerase IB [Planctomycetota bacterium]
MRSPAPARGRARAPGDDAEVRPLLESVAAAREVGLRWVSDAAPGIRRRRAGRGFVFVTPDGRRVADADTLARIRALAIPPAWTEVWVCLVAHGHVQATGRDAAGRKQYRYHARWRAVRSRTKYRELIAFARGLPALRRRVDRDLTRPALDRPRVLAAAVSLLDRGLLRVGNDEYTRRNRSYGLTTLRAHHAQVQGSTIRLRFRGKSGVQRDVAVDDPRLARVVRRCKDLPGGELFQWVDGDGVARDVGSGDVNDYLREVTGQEVTAKDFRTWGGTLICAVTLARLGRPRTKRELKRNVCRAVEVAARHLGNRPATCRGFYVHPAVLEAYEDGRLAQYLRRTPLRERPTPTRGLSREEQQVLALLEAHEARATRALAARA